MFRASSLPLRQGLYTVHTAIGTLHAGYVTASKQSQVGTQFQPG